MMYLSNDSCKIKICYMTGDKMIAHLHGRGCCAMTKAYFENQVQFFLAITLLVPCYQQ